MTDNTENIVEDQEADYIEAIQKIKENSVDKQKYIDLQNENKRLLDALVEGKQINIENKEESADISELRKKLFSGEDLSNLEYVETALELRDAIMESGGVDPFLPCGDNIKITAEMAEQAQNVAEALRECVDFAQGDSGVFTAQFQRITRDVTPGRKVR